MEAQMKVMKVDIVKDLEKYLERKFNELASKMKTQTQEMEQRLEAQIFGLQGENAKLQETVAQVQEDNEEMKAEMGCLKAELHEARNHAISNEQYSRKLNVKIFGMKEDIGEDCISKVVTLAKEKLGVELTESQVIVAHRTRSQRKPQPMIVRFDGYTTKMSVLKVKKSGTSIAEDLCRDLMTVYNRVRDDPRVQSSWAWNGKVHIKDHGDRIHTVRYGQSIDDILGPPEGPTGDEPESEAEADTSQSQMEEDTSQVGVPTTTDTTNG